MSIVATVLRNVIKDANGFDEIEDFWAASSAFKYPFNEQIKSFITKGADTFVKNFRHRHLGDSEHDDGEEFDYNETGSFTDVSVQYESDTEHPQPENSFQGVNDSAFTKDQSRHSLANKTFDSLANETLSESLPFEDSLNITTASLPLTSHSFSSTSAGRLSTASNGTLSSAYQGDVSNVLNETANTVIPQPKGRKKSTGSDRGAMLNDTSLTIEPGSDLDITRNSRRTTLDSVQSLQSEEENSVLDTSAENTSAANTSVSTVKTKNTTVNTSANSSLNSASSPNSSATSVNNTVNTSALPSPTVNTSVSLSRTKDDETQDSVLQTPQTKGARGSRTNSANNSILLTDQSGRFPTTAENSRRVTFDAGLGLSPISGTDDSRLYSADGKVINKARSSLASNISDASTAVGNNARRRSNASSEYPSPDLSATNPDPADTLNNDHLDEEYGSNYDHGGDDGGGYDDNYPEDDPSAHEQEKSTGQQFSDGEDNDNANNIEDEEEMDPHTRSLVSTVHTPLGTSIRSNMPRYGSGASRTNNSVNTSRLSSGGKSSGGKSSVAQSSTPKPKGRPPKSRAMDSSFSMSELNTPVGQKSKYSRHPLTDESYHPTPKANDNTEMETDEEGDYSINNLTNDTGSSPTSNSVNTSSGENLMEVTTFEADKSVLFQISEENPDYVGAKGIPIETAAEVAERERKNAAALRKRKRNRLHDSDSEEEILGKSTHVTTDDEDHSEDSEAEMATRRSRRVTKGKTFQFWRNERPIYKAGTLAGVHPADPTPKKTRPAAVVTGKKKAAGGDKKALKKHEISTFLHDDDEENGNDNLDNLSVDSGAEDDHFSGGLPDKRRKKQLSQLPLPDLPRNVKYFDREEFDEVATWDDTLGDQTIQKVVCKADTLVPFDLPRSLEREPGKDKVGSAATTLNAEEVPGVMSSWVTGFVKLPPSAIKDAEKVGKYNQIFVLAECQNGTVELDIAHPESDAWDADKAQRLLLNKGDTFNIPPGNIYRLENHSLVVPAVFYWTIIKPLEEPPMDDDGEGQSVDEEQEGQNTYDQQDEGERSEDDNRSENSGSNRSSEVSEAEQSDEEDDRKYRGGKNDERNNQNVNQKHHHQQQQGTKPVYGKTKLVQ